MSSLNHASDVAAETYPESSSTQTAQPSARLTLLYMLLVIGIGGIAAVASVYFRRTQTEKTTEFWGAAGIAAFQLAPMVRLEFSDGKEPSRIDLTGMPGLGHLRHALLEQRHYEWDTLSAESLRNQGFATDGLNESQSSAETASAEPLFATLTFWDPRKPEELPPEMPVIQPTSVLLELNSGWVGPATGERSVRLNERSRPAVRHFLTTMRNVKQARYDDRPEG